MSTPGADDDVANEPQGEPRNGLFLRALRVFAGLSAAVALYALWSIERVELDCDLQLAAPSEVRPGETFAVRALVFCDLDAVEGPRLVTPEVTLRALDAQGRELMQPPLEPLRPSALQTLDGVGRAADRDQFLVASAVHDGVPLTVKRALRVRQDAAPERVLPREAGPLQQYALGRVRPLGAGSAPDRLLPRVVGGACVPEQPCTLVVWVGAPAAALALRAGANVSVLRAPDARESEGLATFVLTVHGPEAEVTFEATRAGVPVAERALRLPIALGEVAITGVRSALEVALPPGRSAVTVDAFVEGRWARTRVWAPVRSPAALDLGDFIEGGPADPGAPRLVRLQVRSDRFSSEGAAARLFYVHQGTQVEALGDLARTLEAEPWRSSLAADDVAVTEAWKKQLPTFAREDPVAAAAYLLAPAEALRAQVPLPVSGRPAQLARLERTKVRMRYGVAGALALSAWLIALSITRRGLLAVDQAQAILDQAGRGDEDGRPAARERINARAKVFLMGLAVAAAFLAAALLIAAKSLWF